MRAFLDTTQLDIDIGIVEAELNLQGKKLIRWGKTEALRILNQLPPRTPFATGHARRGWFIDASDQGDQLTIFAINNVEYISLLEFGHSQKAPAGFFRITMLELQQALEDFFGERQAANLSAALARLPEPGEGIGELLARKGEVSEGGPRFVSYEEAGLVDFDVDDDY